MSELTITKIEKSIFIVRGIRVMLDSDLAELYGVETKALNQSVKRNITRFPEDFMFKPNNEELTDLRSQIVTARQLSGLNLNQFKPNLFTENGVAMLSSVINSESAILVNIAIMRIFTKLRSFLVLESELRKDMRELKHGTSTLFKTVFERMDNLEDEIRPKLDPKRKKIGLK